MFFVAAHVFVNELSEKYVSHIFWYIVTMVSE